MSQSPVRTSSLDNHNQGFKLSYINLFQDVRAAMVTQLLTFCWPEQDHVHLNGALKESTLKDMDKYIRKTPKTAVLFDRFRKSGIKLFLLTNSEYHYTNQVMSYLLNNQNPDYKSWTDYFGTHGFSSYWRDRCHHCKRRKANILWTRNHFERSQPRNRSPENRSHRQIFEGARVQWRFHRTVW